MPCPYFPINRENIQEITQGEPTSTLKLKVTRKVNHIFKKRPEEEEKDHSIYGRKPRR